MAFWLDGDELVIASQLEAGPYRYVNEWRLAVDGVIRPRLGCSAATNSVTCKPHVHHAYWRLDFDILAPGLQRAPGVQRPGDPGRDAVALHALRGEAPP